MLVGVGQCLVFDRSAESRVIELSALSAQANFDIAQTLAIALLRKRHREKVLPTRESSNAAIALLALDTAPKLVGRNELEDLPENALPSW